MNDYAELLRECPDMWLFCTPIEPELASEMILEISGLMDIQANAESIRRIEEFIDWRIWNEDMEKDECFLFQSGRKFILLECGKHCDFWEIFIRVPMELRDVVHKPFLKFQKLTDGGYGIISIQYTPRNSTGEAVRHSLNKCAEILSEN